MKVAELWRYPVKSMGGEKLQRATLGPLGIQGDRVVQVEDARGHFATSRRYPRLLALHATLGSGGQPKVDEVVWTDPKVLRQVVDIVGTGARLAYDDSAQRFDVLPLLVATDGAIKEFGYDSRRLRPNIIIEGVEGLAERTWPGQVLRIGDVLIGVQDLRMRCVMTTFDPDTQKQNPAVLKEIVRKFGGELALNCFVIQGGEIQVGDRAELLKQRKDSSG